MDDSSPTLIKMPAPPSLLSADLTITGDLYCEGEVQVDGAVTGNIRSDVLNISETANIDGEIIADSVKVYGRVTGQINAKSVSLTKTAHVHGDILYENLTVDQGAFLEGQCRRSETNKTDEEATINRLMKGAARFNLSPKKTKVEKS